MAGRWARHSDEQRRCADQSLQKEVAVNRSRSHSGRRPALPKHQTSQKYLVGIGRPSGWSDNCRVDRMFSATAKANRLLIATSPLMLTHRQIAPASSRSTTHRIQDRRRGVGGLDHQFRPSCLRQSIQQSQRAVSRRLLRPCNCRHVGEKASSIRKLMWRSFHVALGHAVPIQASEHTAQTICGKATLTVSPYFLFRRCIRARHPRRFGPRWTGQLTIQGRSRPVHCLESGKTDQTRAGVPPEECLALNR